MERDAIGKAHLYRPAQRREQILGPIIGDLLHHAYSGDAPAMIGQVLERITLTQDEKTSVAKLVTQQRAVKNSKAAKKKSAPRKKVAVKKAAKKAPAKKAPAKKPAAKKPAAKAE